ncbi:hypothetical protein AWT69_003621 [Pseudomonas putida]|nr:hypothetical protein AWT69_003621 [Pseudomonas putida]
MLVLQVFVTHLGTSRCSSESGRASYAVRRGNALEGRRFLVIAL